jgi:two-component system response regulator CpxR
MPVANIFCGSYCQAEQIAGGATRKLGYRYVDDDALVMEASERFQIEESKLRRALTGKTSIFNKFTHERERSLAYLKMVLADLLKSDNLVLLGYAGLMIPRAISHVLNVCIIADMKYRTKIASQGGAIAEKDALKRIHKDQ